MKKLLCSVLTACIVLSASFMVTYADSAKGNSGGSGNSSSSSSKSETKDKSSVQTKDSTNTSETPVSTEGTDTKGGKKSQQKVTIDGLKEELKAQHGDKAARLEIIRQIYDLRKENKQESKMIFVNGQEVTSDVPPVLKYGRTLIPVRAITNALGATVEWDAATNTATITKEGTVIKITLGSKVALVNGEEVELGVPAETYNNRTIVPVRFIAETFKKTVEYDAGTGTVIIEDETTQTDSTTDTAGGTTTDASTGTTTDTAGTGATTDTAAGSGTTTPADTTAGTNTTPAN